MEGGDTVTEWRPVSELTPEIVEAAWRLIVWDGSRVVYMLDSGLTEDGWILEYDDNDKWVIFEDNWMENFWPVKWFVVIGAPPEE